MEAHAGAPLHVCASCSCLQRAFPGYKTLNRIQSRIFQTAFTSNENMLVCAPTGEPPCRAHAAVHYEGGAGRGAGVARVLPAAAWPLLPGALPTQCCTWWATMQRAGAGKTNIAMIAVLREVGLNMQHGVIQKGDFKVRTCTRTRHTHTHGPVGELCNTSWPAAAGAGCSVRCGPARRR